MTNNPTIDGVSREQLKKWRRDLDACQRVIWLAGGFDPAYCTDAQECIAQMDSVLDAPAVERQEPVAYRVTYNDGEKGPWLNGAPIELDKSDGADGVIQAVECAYATPTDSVILQSTIARLEARIAELEGGRCQYGEY